MVLMFVRLITGIAIAFSPNWWVFTVLRFFQGYAAISLYIIAFIVGERLKARSTPKNNLILIDADKTKETGQTQFE